MIGRKDDQGKLRWGLLLTTLIKPLEEVVRVLMGGEEKYGANNWQLVANAEARYRDALMRHFAEYCQGVQRDQETGRHHLAHVITNGLFLLWLHFNEPKQKADPQHGTSVFIKPLPSLESLVSVKPIQPSDIHGLGGR